MDSSPPPLSPSRAIHAGRRHVISVFDDISRFNEIDAGKHFFVYSKCFAKATANRVTYVYPAGSCRDRLRNRDTAATVKCLFLFFFLLFFCGKNKINVVDILIDSARWLFRKKKKNGVQYNESTFVVCARHWNSLERCVALKCREDVKHLNQIFN